LESGVHVVLARLSGEEDKTTQATEAYIEREERLELRNDNDKDTEKFAIKVDQQEKRE
jgi:hypothetical protein